jgi:hypothetical protein
MARATSRACRGLRAAAAPRSPPRLPSRWPPPAPEPPPGGRALTAEVQLIGSQVLVSPAVIGHPVVEDVKHRRAVLFAEGLELVNVQLAVGHVARALRRGGGVECRDRLSRRGRAPPSSAARQRHNALLKPPTPLPTAAHHDAGRLEHGRRRDDHPVAHARGLAGRDDGVHVGRKRLGRRVRLAARGQGGVGLGERAGRQ